MLRCALHDGRRRYTFSAGLTFTSMNSTYLIVMAGGIGSRFWPFSRTHHPKQFHDVLGTGRSMLQLTVDRFAGVCPPENVFVVTNRDYVALVS